MNDVFHTWFIRGPRDVGPYVSSSSHLSIVYLREDEYGEGTQYVEVDLPMCSATILTVDTESLVKFFEKVIEDLKALPEITRPTYLP